MYKIFFALIFISELIIASALVFKIRKFNIYVNRLNDKFSGHKAKIRYLFVDARLEIQKFNSMVSSLILLIKEKREEYLLKAAKTFLVYTSLFMLRGKYKNTLLAYQIGKEIYEGINEA